MPKVGMEPVRRQQLIEATINVVANVGLQATTINLISREAGLSSGIISHYFGGKQGLIEATVRYLLDQLKVNLLAALANQKLTPLQRLMAIVETNFSPVQRAPAATKTWLSFWAQSLHDPQLARLQDINKKRLVSNLRYAYRQVLAREQASEAAEMTAALIDGFWLRCSLSEADDKRFDQAVAHCKRFIETQLPATHH
ncbi:transcriptional regulator BetI [Aestuariibacter halophilus]|uniref:HTH-type transcriptional regulator BetI n=1 Tax=Fluctibacter halophilus TaxID=226011 RepID=A0ABS8GF05_9ALTE|nr:transcriptional regulator BetI [Aestuariibacter halophilus]MCC2617776.1 transcriptional regulator BetI [Aestuariibacter halophilus]